MTPTNRSVQILQRQIFKSKNSFSRMVRQENPVHVTYPDLHTVFQESRSDKIVFLAFEGLECTDVLNDLVACVLDIVEHVVPQGYAAACLDVEA